MSAAAGRIPAISRTAAPASSRRRTRLPRCASATRTATGWSSSTSSSPATACRFCCTTIRSTARPTAAGRADALDLGRARQARRRELAFACVRGRDACRRSARSPAGRSPTASRAISRSSRCPGASATTGAAVALDARALWRGAPIAPLLSSFSEEALAAALRRRTGVAARAAVRERSAPTGRQRLRAAAMRGARHRLSRDRRGSRRRGRTPPATRCFATRRTIPRRRQSWSRWGVDGIITDAVDAIRPARAPAAR